MCVSNDCSQLEHFHQRSPSSSNIGAMAALPLDTARLNLVNLLPKSVYFFTQYEQCEKCPYFAYPTTVPSQSNATTKFPTYYSLKYKINDIAVVDSPQSLCTGTLDGGNQGVYNLIIESNGGVPKCILETAKSSKPEIWPIPVVLAIAVIAIIAFYSSRFVYRRWKDDSDTDNNNELNNKVSQRLNSLDAFRGLTILSMIFVNWGAGGYHFLDHAEWDGIRFADFIFPSFIFIMGVTMAISLKNLVIKKDVPILKAYLQVVFRSIKLFIVGLILNSQGVGDIRYLRIPGVLQRFAISYLVVACVHILSLHLSKSEQRFVRVEYVTDLLPYWPDWILAFVMLLLYFCLSFAWKFDANCPRAYVGPGGLHDEQKYPNCVGGAANRIDRALFGDAHIYQYFTAADLYDPKIDGVRQFNLKHDPEGLLGVTTSIFLTIIGLQVGKIVLTYSSTKQRMIRFAVWTLTLATFTAIFAGTGAIPINKNLWSFSFVCVTGSASIAVFSLFYLLIDHFKWWPLGKPLHYPGMNSILLYIGHDFTGGMLPFAYASRSESHFWLFTQNITGVILWLLLSVYFAKKNYFFTL